MKTALKNSAPAIIFFVMMFVIAILANNANAQSTSNMENQFVSFRYDGFTDVNDAPAVVTKQKLEDDEIERKMEYYDPKGLPSIEDIKNNILEEVIEAVTIPEKTIVNLIKEEDSSTANLINPEWNGSWNEYLTNLINEDWDGANRG